MAERARKLAERRAASKAPADQKPSAPKNKKRRPHKAEAARILTVGLSASSAFILVGAMAVASARPQSTTLATTQSVAQEESRPTPTTTTPTTAPPPPTTARPLAPRATAAPRPVARAATPTTTATPNANANANANAKAKPNAKPKPAPKPVRSSGS
jgi:hypothetical protein